jgi:hypothetical protein
MVSDWVVFPESSSRRERAVAFEEVSAGVADGAAVASDEVIDANTSVTVAIGSVALAVAVGKELPPVLVDEELIDSVLLLPDVISLPDAGVLIIMDPVSTGLPKIFSKLALKMVAGTPIYIEFS